LPPYALYHSGTPMPTSDYAVQEAWCRRALASCPDVKGESEREREREREGEKERERERERGRERERERERAIKETLRTLVLRDRGQDPGFTRFS